MMEPKSKVSQKVDFPFLLRRESLLEVLFYAQVFPFKPSEK